VNPTNSRQVTILYFHARFVIPSPALLRVRLEERERTIQSQNHLIQHLSSLLHSLGNKIFTRLHYESLPSAGMKPERDMVTPTPCDFETPEITETTSVSEDPLVG